MKYNLYKDKFSRDRIIVWGLVVLVLALAISKTMEYADDNFTIGVTIVAFILGVDKLLSYGKGA